MKDMTQKQSIWVLCSDTPHCCYLFKGNPNSGVPGVPPYHLGGIENLLLGEVLVWEHTRSVLEKYIDIQWWNERFPKQRVKPKSIMVEMRPYYKRAKKEGGAE